MALDMNKIPHHIAIIMDGNGRWAEGEGRERIYGHAGGVEAVRQVVNTAARLGVKFLTIYAFSTENWGRPHEEVDALMQLLSRTIVKEVGPLRENGVKLRFIGDIAGMPSDVQESVRQAEAMAPDKVNMTLTIALNYSSRWEIAAAVRKMTHEALQGNIVPGQIDEKLISSYLETCGMPDPDLLIRTSGEQRLSNFLLWQLSYAELYFTPVLWPDFGAEQLTRAIEEFQRRDRRFGLTTKDKTDNG